VVVYYELTTLAPRWPLVVHCVASVVVRDHGGGSCRCAHFGCQSHVLGSPWIQGTVGSHVPTARVDGEQDNPAHGRRVAVCFVRRRLVGRARTSGGSRRSHCPYPDAFKAGNKR
jgi:hypothetical protein